MKIVFRFAAILTVLFFSLSSVAEFKIIPRKEWNAEVPQTAQMKPVNPQAYNAITLHFPVGAELSECNSKLMTEERLPDIPFQFLIDQCGNIYQGQELNTLPLHAGSTLEFQQQMNLSLNPNFKNMGIALLSRSASQISTAQQAAAVWLIDHLRSQFNIQSLLDIEQLKKSVELCDAHYIANGFIKTINSMEQNEATKKIQKIFKDVVQLGRHNSLCTSNY